jgi:hypothetical protein
MHFIAKQKYRKLNKVLITINSFVNSIFNSQHDQKGHLSSPKIVLILNFLTTALQLMPI